ncbi:MAG TPA: RDD family protein [Micromonosporaceae bacterium]|nr:RDD family protein [Micromonosporaceae bacterium]
MTQTPSGPAGPVPLPGPPAPHGQWAPPRVPGRGPAPGYQGAPYQPSPGHRPPPPTAPGGAPLAELGDRLLAYLVDAAILGGVSAIFILPALFYQLTLMVEWQADFVDRYDAPGSPPPDPGEVLRDMLSTMAPVLWLYLGAAALGMVAAYVYRVEMMWRTGQTVGKRLMSLRVVRLDAPAAPLTRTVAAKRWLVDSVAVQLVPLLGLLDGLWQLWDQPYRQCLHDKAAGTTVVKVAR